MRKPKFRRQDSHKKVKVKEAWRRPKGLQSKMRLRKRGYPTRISIGWRAPRATRGKTSDGLEKVIVSTSADISGIDPKKQVVVFSSGLGTRKKLQLLKEAEEKKVTILNVKEGYAEKALEKIKQRKEQRDSLKKEREKKRDKKAKEKKVEEKKEEKTEEEKKVEEKKEKDKILTHKQ